MVTALYHEYHIVHLFSDSSEKLPTTTTPSAVGVLQAFCCLFIVIVLCLYICGLVAVAGESTKPILQAQLRSITDVIRQTKVTFGGIKGCVATHFLKNSPNGEYRKAYDIMTNSAYRMVGSRDGIQRVLQGGYALFAESTFIDFVTSQNCQLVKVGGGDIKTKGYGLVTALGSKLRDPLNSAIQELEQSGELRDLKVKWWDARSLCSAPPPVRMIGFPVTSLCGPLVLLLIGVIVAIIMTIVARVRYHVTNQKQDVEANPAK